MIHTVIIFDGKLSNANVVQKTIIFKWHKWIILIHTQSLKNEAEILKITTKDDEFKSLKYKTEKHDYWKYSEKFQKW